ncbi:MAG: DMT family transporter [bacterium]|nr:DMT family transporter [bacterium]
MSPRRLGALAICAAAALWGLDGVVLTPRLYNLPVLLVVFLLHAVPFLLMQPVLAKSYLRLRRLDGGQWVTLVAVAVTGGVLGTLAIVRALFLVDFNQLSVVVLLQKFQPVFAVGLAAILLRERLTRGFLAGAALAVLGGYLLTFGWRLPDFSSGARTTEAAGTALLAAASFGAATVFGKKLLASLDFGDATFARYGLTTALTAVLLVVTGTGFPFGGVTPGNWMTISIIAVTTGSGAIFLFYFGLQRVPARIAAVCELCLPLSAVTFDYFVNGSVLSPIQVGGALLMIGSITRVSSLEEQPHS